jgi:hypothetical protein
MAEREQIHRHDEAREKLREDLAAGRISKEEAEQRERELDQSQPERMRGGNEARAGQKAENDTSADTAFNAEEEATLNAGAVPSGPGLSGPG